jgi:hypothetical protein
MIVNAELAKSFMRNSSRVIFDKFSTILSLFLVVTLTLAKKQREQGNS